MTLQTPPFALENVSTHTAPILRQAASSAITPGVVGAGDFLTTANGTPNMTVNIAASSIGAWVAGTQQAPKQSKYFVFNDATVNLAIAASDPTHGRIDVPCITIQDSQYTAGPDTALLQVITGTPSSSPVVPTLPANSMPLSHVAVGAGVTSILTANITFVAPVASSTVNARGIPVARLHQATNQGAIGDSTWTQVTNLTFDYFSGVTVGTNSLTIVTPGVYRLNGVVHLTAMAAAGNTMESAVYVNGARAIGGWMPADNGNQGIITAQGSLQLAVGDVIKLYVFGAGVGGFSAGTQSGSADTYLEVALESG